MPEFGGYQDQSVVEIQRPQGTRVLPDEFIDGASGVGGVEELGKFFDEHLHDVVFDGVQNQDEAKKIQRALGVYAIRKERTWQLQKNADKSKVPDGWTAEDWQKFNAVSETEGITPDWQRGVEDGMKQILTDVMGLKQEVSIVDHLFKQAESAPAYINVKPSTPRIASSKR